MEIVNSEAVTFSKMKAALEELVGKLQNGNKVDGKYGLEEWLDNQDVCRYLNISPRTLQTLRDNGTLPFSQINHKIFYKPEDVQGIVKKVEDRRKEALYRGRNI